MVVWGGFSKTEIAPSFSMGFRRAIYQIRGIFFLYHNYSVNGNAIRFIHQKR